MAWTATVGESYQHGTNVVTVVHLDNGVDPVFRERFTTDGSGRALKHAVLAWIAKRDATTHDLKCVPPGTTVVLDPDPPESAPPPSADELLARDFEQAWWTYVCLKIANAEALGTAAQNNAVATQLAEAKAAVQALYRQKPTVCIPIMRRNS